MGHPRLHSSSSYPDVSSLKGGNFTFVNIIRVLPQLLKEPAPAVRIRDNRNGHRWLYTGRSVDQLLHSS